MEISFLHDENIIYPILQVYFLITKLKFIQFKCKQLFSFYFKEHEFKKNISEVNG